eukprot:31065-Pelagococcus_subviridis.AAC.13
MSSGPRPPFERVLPSFDDARHSRSRGRSIARSSSARTRARCSAAVPRCVSRPRTTSVASSARDRARVVVRRSFGCIRPRSIHPPRDPPCSLRRRRRPPPDAVRLLRFLSLSLRATQPSFGFGAPAATGAAP